MKIKHLIYPKNKWLSIGVVGAFCSSFLALSYSLAVVGFPPTENPFLDSLVFESMLLVLMACGFFAMDKTEGFYLAGLLTIPLFIQSIIVFFAKGQLSYESASPITGVIAIIIANVIMWLPLYPLFILLIAIAGFSNTSQIGKAPGKIIGWSAMTYLLFVAVNIVGWGSNVSFFVTNLSLGVVFATCGIVFVRILYVSGKSMNRVGD